MRKLSLLLLACLTLGIAWAERVNVTTAQQVAASVAAGLNPSNLRSSSDIKLVYAAPAQSASGLRATGGESDYYIFNVGKDGGFVIVSGEDRVRPVLGYSDEGSVDMERMPENMKAWLSGYQEEIAWAVQQDIATTESVQKEWNEYLSGSSAMGTPVVSLKTAQWAQGDPYNRQTPTIGDQHALTGCVATAMAIIMAYHEAQPIVKSSQCQYFLYPDSENPIDANITYEHPYDWKLMSNTDYNSPGFSDEAVNAIAELMWHCGANAKMQYGLDEHGGSGALFINATKALRDVYGFGAIRRVQQTYYNLSEWISLVKNELNNERPVFYDGQDINGQGGHAFICDGYTTDDYFHINWGWGYRNPASFSDYYLLTCLDAEGTNWDFSRDCGMLVDAYLTSNKPVVELRFNNLSSESSLPVGQDFTITCGLRNIGGASFIGSVGIGRISKDGTIKEVFTEIIVGTEEEPLLEDYGWPSGLEFTCNLSSALADGEVLAPIYKAAGGDWQVMDGNVKGIGMNGIIEKDEIDEPTVSVQMMSNPFHFRYLAVNDEFNGYSQSAWKVEPVQYKLTGAVGDVWVCYTLANPAWVNTTSISYDIEKPVYSENSQQMLKFDAEGKAWVKVPAANITDGLVTNYLHLNISEKTAENFDYSISLYNADRNVCYQTFDYTMPVISQPMEWVFNPTELIATGNTNEYLFSVTAKNVDAKMANQQTSISLSIEGSHEDEVGVDLITEEGRKALNMLPVDSNGCNTEAEIVENLVEGQEYHFALRFVGDKQPGGIIRIADVFIDGNMRAAYKNSELPITTALTIDVTEPMSYNVAHKGAYVTVHENGVYIINTPNASISSLRILLGGQIRLQQPLEVGQLSVSRDIPTDKWTTFAVPQSSQNIMIGDGHDEILAEGSLMAGRKGYTSADDQLWTPQYEASFVPGTAVLLANANGGGLVGFHNEEFYNETLTPMTLPVRPYTEIDGNQPNGTWFHFVANPLWENLQIDGRAYVLDETGKNFALRENPTIKPFEAYMIASDEVMDNVSNLRIGGVPTSNEEMMATGFRAWSESGHICFETTEAKDVAIYSMTGVQLQRIERSVGTKRVALNQGIYIVVCDGTAYKVSVK